LNREQSVSVEEIARLHTEAFLQTQNIVWRQKDVHIMAASIEAGNAGMTSKLEGVIET